MATLAELKANATDLLRELCDLAVCQAAEQVTDPEAAKRTQRERDELAERFVNAMVTVAEEAKARR